ncbi:ABC transporter permease [Pleomorphomonas carboxyditropha]|uniref:Spermidine/putrescine ABC transporter permease n=1 Tax=Pleomorphomonas carboxyditropha TaxID=2023338 RepID=A0A2G9WS10_9HYPH|nr:ABC transporter permease subunit [Pleomorphomonas carboxyditropha]PIO96930.1 spermidine/putrescine ABC transporter permease [Pleomorphomonas carboxyditropha]
MITASHPRAEGGGLSGLLLVALPVALLIWLVLWPVLQAVVGTVYFPGKGFSLSSYAFFFTDAYSLRNLWLTLWVTALTSALRVAVAMPIALYLRFRSGSIAALVQSLALFPLFVPSVLVAYAFIRVLGPNGIVDTVLVALGLPKLPTPYLTPAGPIIGLVWERLPLTLLLLLSGLGRVSIASVDAARDLGAGGLTIFSRIILPRIQSSIIVALAFNVLGLFSAFTLPYLLGPASPEMMGPYMQRTFSDNADPLNATTQAVITFAFCAAFGLVYVRAIARGRRGPA